MNFQSRGTQPCLTNQFNDPLIEGLDQDKIAFELFRKLIKLNSIDLVTSQNSGKNQLRIF